MRRKIPKPKSQIPRPNGSFGQLLQIGKQFERLPRRRVVDIDSAKAARNLIIARGFLREQGQLRRLRITGRAGEGGPPAAGQLIAFEAAEDLLRARDDAAGQTSVPLYLFADAPVRP